MKCVQSGMWTAALYKVSRPLPFQQPQFEYNSPPPRQLLGYIYIERSFKKKKSVRVVCSRCKYKLTSLISVPESLMGLGRREEKNRPRPARGTAWLWVYLTAAPAGEAEQVLNPVPAGRGRVEKCLSFPSQAPQQEQNPSRVTQAQSLTTS